MRIETKLSNPGELFVYFEMQDFRRRDEDDREIWIKAKDEIKERFPYPLSRWNPEEGCWIIKDSFDAREVIREIWKKYFENKNQTSLEI